MSPRRRALVTFLERLQTALNALTIAMAYLSGASFVLMSLFIAFEVVARRWFGFTSGATDEISGYMLAFGVAFAQAYTARTQGHIRIDIVSDRLPARVRALLFVAGSAALFVFVAILTYFVWRMTLDSLEVGTRSVGILSFPRFIPQGMVAIGLTVFTVQGLALLIEHMVRLPSNLVAETRGEGAVPAV